MDLFDYDKEESPKSDIPPLEKIENEKNSIPLSLREKAIKTIE